MERGRLRRHLRLYVALWVLGVLVVAEDVLFFLVVDPATLGIGPWAFTSERNYAENALMLVCMFVACRDAFRTLALRFEHPPAPGGERREAVLNDTLMRYGKQHQLSEREREVLYLVLQGNDNQNIASSLQLSPSTVKVHVHNILQKNRSGEPSGAYPGLLEDVLEGVRLPLGHRGAALATTGARPARGCAGGRLRPAR